MKILLTGCTGFVGRFILLELVQRGHGVVVLVRTKRGKSANERWEQLKRETLFRGVDLSDVEVKEGDLHAAKDVNFQVIVHAAAIVKTSVSFDEMYQSNVLAVRELCNLSKARRTFLHLISTCYVHGPFSHGRAEQLPLGLDRSTFLDDYTYTKYLGECETHGMPNVTISRLSCVGPPGNWLDAHPCRAMAHVGVVSLILRGKFTRLDRDPSLKVNTIPVTVVAKTIADRLTDSGVRQLCAGQGSPWNLSVNELFLTAKKYAPSTWSMSDRFNVEMNKYIRTFAVDRYFESSVEYAAVPEMYEQVVLYAARGFHTSTLRPLDIFWGSMKEHIIQVPIVFRRPLAFETGDDAVRRVFHCFSSYRPFTTSVFGHGITVGWKKAVPPYTIHIQINGPYTRITGIHLSIHHGVGDGVALRGLIARIDSLHLSEPYQTIPVKNSRATPLSVKDEVKCVVSYLKGLITILRKPRHQSAVRKETLSQQTFNKSVKSFTAALIDRTYDCISPLLGRDVVYCIPAVLEFNRGLDTPCNRFVPLLLVWSDPMAEMCLRSKAVRVLMWFILSYLPEVRDIFMERVDVVLSSLILSDEPHSNIETLHVISPVATTIPFSVNAVTVGKETYLSACSSNPVLPCEAFMACIKGINSHSTI